MNWAAAIYLAVRDAVRHKTLVLIVALALTISISNIVITVGYMRGFEKVIVEDIVEVSAGHVIVSPVGNEDYIRDPLLVVDKAERLPEVRYATLQNRVSAEIKKTTGEMGLVGQIAIRGIRATLLLAVDPEKEELVGTWPRKIVKGEFLSGERGEILLGYSLAHDYLNADVGDLVDVRFPNGVTETMKVKGIFRTGFQLFDLTYALINLGDAQRVLGAPGKYNVIAIKLTDRGLAEQVKTKLLAEGINAKAETWEESLEYAKQLLSLWAAILLVVSVVSIVAASASVAVLMFLNVLGRTRQIGTLKAMGASNEFIAFTFVAEAMVIGVFGVIVGDAVATGLVNALAARPVMIAGQLLQFVPDPAAVAWVSVIALVMVFFAALYPAYRAARLEVVEALRYE